VRAVRTWGALQGEPGEPDLLKDLPAGVVDSNRLLPVKHVDLDPRLIAELPDPETVENHLRPSVGTCSRALPHHGFSAGLSDHLGEGHDYAGVGGGPLLGALYCEEIWLDEERRPRVHERLYTTEEPHGLPDCFFDAPLDLDDGDSGLHRSHIGSG
jgi:hypothetical protein